MYVYTHFSQQPLNVFVCNVLCYNPCKQRQVLNVNIYYIMKTFFTGTYRNFQYMLCTTDKKYLQRVKKKPELNMNINWDFWNVWKTLTLLEIRQLYKIRECFYVANKIWLSREDFEQRVTSKDMFVDILLVLLNLLPWCRICIGVVWTKISNMGMCPLYMPPLFIDKSTLLATM